MFYELYVADKGHKMVPVPIRIVNMKTSLSGTVTSTVPINQLYPKDLLCDTNDQLVKRFFLFDVVSGITTSSSTTFEIMRYGSYFHLQVALDPNKIRKIYAPVLTVYYEEVTAPTPSQVHDGYAYTVPVEVDGTYTMSMTSFKKTMYVFFVLTIIFASLYWLCRVYYWNLRHTRSPTIQGLQAIAIGGSVSFQSVLEIAVIGASAWNNFFFPFTLIITWYFFLFFKVQYRPYVFMPPQYDIYIPTSPYYVFVVNLYLMAFFQLFIVIALVVKQCRSDIFFIDWEPFKTVNTQRQRDATTGKSKSGAPQTEGKVSVWRSIMVANEWAEMQTVRKTDIRFTLFWIAFFLLGLNLQYNATIQPSLSDLSVNQINVVLRFANSTFFWLAFTAVQYLFKYLFYERFFGEPPEQVFIDFCTIAKVSVFVLDEPFHGYYLHCRSPHEFADGSMTELVEMLHNEEKGLVTDRGLDDAPNDVQSFEVFLSGEFRAAFDKIYINLCGPSTVTEAINSSNRNATRNPNTSSSSGNRERGVRLGSINYLPSERVMKAWKELTVFLQEFVENNFGKSGMRRIIKEPTYVDRLLGTAPDLSVPDQPSVFVVDKEYEYCRVMFLGREYPLLLLNILCYSLVDLWFNSVAISILITYLLEMVLCYVRQAWGQTTLSRKTLIDERFLI